MSPARPLSVSPVLYRYWFFGWLFRDASRGNALERATALKQNVESARWLPTYMRRWITLGLLMYLAGVALETMGHDAIASIAFVSACASAPVLSVAFAVWWVLRGPRSAYVQ